MIFKDERRPRTEQGPPLAGYPAAVRRLFFWFDQLSDAQRLKYALAAILFLLACGGYLLGLGSAIVLQRVEAESNALAAEPLPTEELAPTPDVAAGAQVEPSLAPTAQPSPTSLPPTPQPTATPFSAPVIADVPAVPRQLPAAPVVVAPVAPRTTPTAAKPRNLETSKPEPPAVSIATPTRGVIVVRTPISAAPTAVRQATAARPLATRPPTPLPTLALHGATATPVPSRPTPTPARTPPVR